MIPGANSIAWPPWKDKPVVAPEGYRDDMIVWMPITALKAGQSRNGTRSRRMSPPGPTFPALILCHGNQTIADGNHRYWLLFERGWRGLVPVVRRSSDTVLRTIHVDRSEQKRQPHYLWSNEQRHDLFFSEILNLGGGYVGVGADQNYTLAAAARADSAWLIDLDAAIVSLHALYRAALSAAPTAQDFLLLLSGRSDVALGRAAEQYLADKTIRTSALRIYENHGPLIALRLSSRRAAPGNWLSNETFYQHVRTLAIAGRLTSQLGNLNGPSSLIQIGNAARSADVPIRILYLSNAESWFDYNDRLLSNLQSLSFDERSVVLRTVKSPLLRRAPGDVWHFSMQGAQDFIKKLALRRHYRNVEMMLADLDAPRGIQPGRPRGLSRIEPASRALLSSRRRR